MKTDVEIAQEAEMRPIQEIAEKLGIDVYKRQVQRVAEGKAV